MENIDKEMRTDITDQRKTRVRNMVIFIVVTGIVLMSIAILGGYWTVGNEPNQNHNMGADTAPDTTIMQSDTLHK